MLQLQLMTAMIADPGYRPEALWQFQKSIPVLFQNLDHTTGGPMKEMNAWLHGGDSRFSLPSQTELSNYTIADVEKWLTPELEEGYIEMTIVGDFNRNALLTDLLSTIGTLTPRDVKPATED